MPRAWGAARAAAAPVTVCRLTCDRMLHTVVSRSSVWRSCRGGHVVTCAAADVPSTHRSALLRGAAAFIGGCSCCPPGARADAWTYGNVTGPSSWPGVCATGNRQSPISLPLNSESISKTRSAAPYFKYRSFEMVDVLNTGHGTMQVNFPEGNICTIGGMELELVQYHFHTPSEHSLGGIRWPMEAHLVHRDTATGQLAVLGILLEREGAVPNPCLDLALRSAPASPQQTVSNAGFANAAQLLPGGGTDASALHYAHYVGSLTTPPCSEDVDWFVFVTPIKVTDSQVLDFMRFVGGGTSYASNARPLQPFNERNVEVL